MFCFHEFQFLLIGLICLGCTEYIYFDQNSETTFAGYRNGKYAPVKGIYVPERVVFLKLNFHSA